MQFKKCIFSVGVLIVSVVFYKYLRIDLIELCDLDKCPYCYGTDLCGLFQDGKVTLSMSTPVKIFSNHFSAKNVFYGKCFNEHVVLKKLAHENELREFDEVVCNINNLETECNLSVINDTHSYKQEVLNLLNDKNRQVVSLKVCSEPAAAALMGEFVSQHDLKTVWTLLMVNAEPLILKLLDKGKKKWPVPKYLGSCGRLTVQTDCGASLNEFRTADWIKRAYLGYQLLLAAKNFTFNHEKFRFYLTDISPDNIAVDRGLKLSFVDLENVIITLKAEGSSLHQSKDFEEGELFIYSDHEICGSSLSDHNLYAICKLLLSQKAPWPMMEQGLLHSTPESIKTRYGQLSSDIELCVNPKDTGSRFVIVDRILKTLENILYRHKNDL